MKILSGRVFYDVATFVAIFLKPANFVNFVICKFHNIFKIKIPVSICFRLKPELFLGAADQI